MIKTETRFYSAYMNEWESKFILPPFSIVNSVYISEGMVYFIWSNSYFKEIIPGDEKEIDLKIVVGNQIEDNNDWMYFGNTISDNSGILTSGSNGNLSISLSKKTVTYHFLIKEKLSKSELRDKKINHLVDSN
jgi:hypothetical protein